MTSPKVLIPVALGTNRDADMAAAFLAAGAEPECVPLTALRSGERRLADYQILAVPGGFSYGDALGAGRLFGLDLAEWFGDQLRAAVDDSMPIIGVCNGFQALVAAGVLPGGDTRATLTENANRTFECRWVTMAASGDSPWLAQIDEPIRCPIAHGEGRFVAADLETLEQQGRVAVRYTDAAGEPADGRYPLNPNGSANDVAGIVDASGLVIGMMPHPENHISPLQDPLRGRVTGGSCLPLFRGGVQAA